MSIPYKTLMPMNPKNIKEGTLKFNLEHNGFKSWGVTDIKQKTAYKKDKPDELATPTDIKEGNYRYPGRYFAYLMLDDQPTIFIENRDKIKTIGEGGKVEWKWSPRYFKPATIVFHETKLKWTHNDRVTGLPFLTVVYGTTPATRVNESVRIGQMFHIDEKGWIHTKKIPENVRIVKTSRLNGGFVQIQNFKK